MLHILGFFVTFVIGGLTGVMVAIVPFDWQAHDTAFVTAHLHYVLFGGFVFPVLAGIYCWLPHFTGRTRFFHIGEVGFVLIFVGFHGTGAEPSDRAATAPTRAPRCRGSPLGMTSRKGEG